MELVASLASREAIERKGGTICLGTVQLKGLRLPQEKGTGFCFEMEFGPYSCALRQLKDRWLRSDSS